MSRQIIPHGTKSGSRIKGEKDLEQEAGGLRYERTGVGETKGYK